MSVCNFKIASDQPLSQPFTDRRTVQRRFGNRTVRRLLHRPPTFTAAVLFLLVLSGPPRFRARDPEASLRGDIDWVVMVHVVVWVAAGLWVLTQVGKRFRGKSPLLRLRPPAFLGMAMILWLAASTGVSDSPALTLFKAYQMLVSMLFVHIFVQQSGAKTSLRAVFLGNTLLSIAITCCAFFAPDLVWRWSDFNPDPSRLSGDLIAPTGVVAALGIILLLTSIKKMWRVLPMCLLALFFGLLALSLMRTAYVVVFLFFALALLKRPRVKFLRHIVYLTCALGLLLVAYDLGPHLSKYRDPGSISSLSDRVGLWRHLADVTMHRSPWLGLGYYAASRIYGPEYNPGLGTAH